MADVSETTLPGLGVRYDFETSQGIRIGVLVRRTGRRDLLIYSRDDPDACTAELSLEPDDALALAELLGAPRIAEHLAAVQQHVEGLSIDWLVVEEGAEWAGMALRDARVRTNTGVSVVALIRGDGVIAAPGADDVLEPGATVVAVGSAEGLEAFASKIGRG
jgi:TrkA domain protein